MPNRKKRQNSSPDYFIKAGDSDLGAAWKANSQAKKPVNYLRCVLDDPSFVGPVQAALFDREGGADLAWKRN